jgi:hypothetical protein
VDDGLAPAVCPCAPGGAGASAETCDGVDDDCGGVVDDGTLLCGSASACACAPGGAGAPGVEVCNAVDDDCNGTVDDGIGGCACTACGVAGGEACNLVDDDCNGVADDGLDPAICPCTAGGAGPLAVGEPVALLEPAARALAGRLKKRALIVLLTSLRDDDAGELVPAIQTLRRRHLVLVADFRESVLDQLRLAPVTGFEGALRHAAGADLRARRAELHERLGQSGVHMLDVSPAELPVRLVNRYLDIKASGLL